MADEAAVPADPDRSGAPKGSALALPELVVAMVRAAPRHNSVLDLIAAMGVLGIDEHAARSAVERVLEYGPAKLCSRMHVVPAEAPDRCREPPRCACGRELGR